MEAPFEPLAEFRRIVGLPRDAHGRLDPRRLDSSAAIDALKHLQSLIAHLHAVQADLLVAAAGLEPSVDEFPLDAPTNGRPDGRSDGRSDGQSDGQSNGRQRTVRIVDADRDEIAAALRWSNAFAYTRIDEARLLHAHLPATLTALRQGEVSPRHAGVIAEAAGRFSSRDATTDADRAVFERSCASLEARVLPVARQTTIARTRSVARRAVGRIDADHRRRRAIARRGPDVTMWADEDGISCVMARMSTPAAHALIEAVQRHSLTIDDPSLTAGERRAQALMSLVFGEAPPRVRLDVVLSGSSGLAMADAMADATSWVATVRGGEVDPESLRELLADPEVDATVRKFVADEVTGQLSGVGRTSYRLPTALRDFIVQRDQTCRFPGCGRRAELGQIDHAIAWDAGGSTDADNLGALCVRHHQLKTHGGWQITASEPDGSCTWQSPQGRRYRRRPSAARGVPLESTLARVLATTRTPTAEAAATGSQSMATNPDPPPF